MKYRLIGVILILVILTSATACVSKSNYETLLADYITLAQATDALNQQNENYGAELKLKALENDSLKKNNETQITENQALKAQLDKSVELLDLKESENEDLRQKDSVLAYQALEQKNMELAQEIEQIRAESQTLTKNIAQLESRIEEYKELDLYKDIWSSSVFSGVQPFYSGINLVNNSAATDPSYKELISFIKADKTDRNAYITGFYMCGDFAEDVHNNAERAGIKAGLVGIQFDDGPGHACNIFKTTDKGLVFIDCTGLEVWDIGPASCDKKVIVKVGAQYRPKPLVDTNWRWFSMGEIVDVEIYW